MLKFLEFCAYLLAMLSIVPLAGLFVSGSWRGAWEYSKAWGRSIGILIAAALVVLLMIWPFMPGP